MAVPFHPAGAPAGLNARLLAVGGGVCGVYTACQPLPWPSCTCQSNSSLPTTFPHLAPYFPPIWTSSTHVSPKISHLYPARPGGRHRVTPTLRPWPAAPRHRGTAAAAPTTSFTAQLIISSQLQPYRRAVRPVFAIGRGPQSIQSRSKVSLLRRDGGAGQTGATCRCKAGGSRCNLHLDLLLQQAWQAGQVHGSGVPRL